MVSGGVILGGYYSIWGVILGGYSSIWGCYIRGLF